jgi:hypothetical protein
MQRYRLLVLFGFLLTASFVVSASPAQPAKPDFVIAATNVTMTSAGSTGTGSAAYTLTSLDGYTGTVQVACDPPNPPAGGKIPYCGGGPVRPPYTLTANQVVTGSISLYNIAVPALVSLPGRGGHRLAQGLALAGMLLFGFGFRRKAARWLTLTLFAMGTLVVLGEISACGANNNNAVTPGTYAYTVIATDINTSVSSSATINVTVP